MVRRSFQAIPSARLSTDEGQVEDSPRREPMLIDRVEQVRQESSMEGCRLMSNMRVVEYNVLVATVITRVELGIPTWHDD